MPKSGTWPGGVALDSLSNMDSAGSCDSVISMNSGYSEDSMEHLSAEERACLMYLEETIEALEVQEDSGLSNDEPDPVLRAETTGRTRVNDISALGSAESGRLLNHTLDQTSEPQKDLNTSAYLTTQPKPPATEPGAEIHQSATKTDELFVSKDDNGKIRIVSSTSPSAKASEMDLSLIPPPSAFMDEPGPPPQPEKAKQPPPPAGIYNDAPEATVDLEQLLQGASMKTTSVSSPVTLATSSGPQLTPSTVSSGPQLSPSTVSSGPQLSPLTISSGPQLSPSPLSSGPQLSPLTISSGPQFSPLEAVDPKSPPAVAPKPKKLPANIILKSHKAAATDGNSVHSVPTGSDRLLLDPQKVRMEALRKLGLLKSDEADPGPILSPKLSPQTRRSWAAPPSPKSPAKSHTPPSTPSYTPLRSPSPASAPPQSPAPAEILLPDIVPAPPAFSDPDGPPPSDNEPVNTPPHTAPSRLKQLTPPKGVKAATLERSGPGLSSFMETQGSAEAGANSTQSPSQLRNSRPRPASLGSGKEFSSAQGEGSQLRHATGKEPELRRSLPAFQQSADSQKLPRSQGISVLICPRAENGDDRREALRRLGLLRD